MIEPIKESEEDDLKPKEENMKEDPQLADCATHTLAGHANPQAMKVEESLKQQSVTVLIETKSTNNFMNTWCAIYKGHEEASIRAADQDPKSWSLSLEDKTDLKRTGLLGPQLMANGGDNSNDKGQSKSREEAGGVGCSRGVGIHKQGAGPTVEEEEAGDGR
ncbi:hypothetical protein BHM03_00006262 [Ensete ventricosum]|uniref:Uncharacterized protein n=1 Tax=Ensete ventricosum TaxID=4639 RepID=A0A445MBN3_ENSVE|nr:hypothetical protein BHM03_00006262 [Ensete ventricosum]